MICVSLSGAVWLEDGPACHIKGPDSMYLFDIDGPEDDDDLLHSGDRLDTGVEYSVWPDGTDRNEFRLMVERHGETLSFAMRHGEEEDWQEVKATAPVIIDRRKTVWERLTEED